MRQRAAGLAGSNVPHKKFAAPRKHAAGVSGERERRDDGKEEGTRGILDILPGNVNRVRDEISFVRAEGRSVAFGARWLGVAAGVAGWVGCGGMWWGVGGMRCSRPALGGREVLTQFLGRVPPHVYIAGITTQPPPSP